MTPKPKRLSAAAKEFNIASDRIVSFLEEKGHTVENKPTTKLTLEQYECLLDEFQSDKDKKAIVNQVGQEKKEERAAFKKDYEQKIQTAKPVVPKPKIVGKLEENEPNEQEKAAPKNTEKAQKIETSKQKLPGLKNSRKIRS